MPMSSSSYLEIPEVCSIHNFKDLILLINNIYIH